MSKCKKCGDYEAQRSCNDDADYHVDSDDKKLRVYSRKRWHEEGYFHSDVNIEFCPFCGRKLEEQTNG